MKFTFANMKYTGTSKKGINVKGDILLDGRLVGAFYQKAYAACVPTFFYDDARGQFMNAAGAVELTDFAEQLLEEAEDALLSA